MLKLYDYYRSSACYRVRIALHHKGLEFIKIPVNLLTNEQKKPNYLKINPQGLVPGVLTENNQLITQSLAIIEYLDAIDSKNLLIPKAPLEASYVRSLSLTIACDIHPLNNLGALNFLRQEFKHNEEEINLWYQTWITKGLASLEEKIATSDFYIGEYCYLNQVSLADICLIPQFFNAKRFNCPIQDYKVLNTIYEKCNRLEAFIKASPGNDNQ